MKYPILAAGAVTVLILLVVIPVLLSSCASNRTQSSIQSERLQQSPQYLPAEKQFVNSVPRPSQGLKEVAGIIWEMATGKDPRSVPSQAIPVRSFNAKELQQLPAGEHRVYRIGHSTLLLALNGELWLLDPVFSERASPVQWAGPKRFHQPPIGLDELPALTGIIISHNHYDHLDEASIRALADRAEGFYVPLGLGQYLRDWGVSEERIHEHDWWQETRVGDTLLAATPAQHFSGRGVLDGDETLWASWVIIRDDKRYFFSGDGGYFDGFKSIGERYGPFDLTMIENGAYNPRWAHVHMMPEQSVQAHIDLRGKQMLPIHNSTFDLSIHAWYDPLEQVRQQAEQRNIALVTPTIGEGVIIGSEQRFSYWWQPLIEEEIAGQGNNVQEIETVAEEGDNSRLAQLPMVQKTLGKATEL